jgi:hypothetical protein
MKILACFLIWNMLMEQEIAEVSWDFMLWQWVKFAYTVLNLIESITTEI